MKEFQRPLLPPLGGWRVKRELEMERPAASPRRSTWVGLAVTTAFVIFLVGFLPPTYRMRDATTRLVETRDQLAQAESRFSAAKFDLELAGLHGQAGEVLQFVSENDFDAASEVANRFFDGVRAATTNEHAVAGSDRRNVLDAALARRDEISSDLMRGNADVKAKVAELYMQFAAVTR